MSCVHLFRIDSIAQSALIINNKQVKISLYFFFCIFSLQIGRPPLQPVYDGWIDCWKDLGKLNVLNRGSSFVCRYYTGPTVLVGGIKQPSGMYFGPNHLPTYRLT